MPQLPLPASPDRPLTPAPARPHPAIWVRRVALLESADPAALIREVTLRRGLNIIWAPPRDDGPVALYSAGLTGHTAGKTTLCRIIRHLLGDPKFASDNTTQRIRASLPKGWMLGELVVDGEDFVVARPFSPAEDRGFAVRASSWREAFAAQYERLELRAFTQHIHAVALGPLGDVSYPNAQVKVAWAHLLPWLTRDQECRFADLLGWRVGSDLHVEDLNFLVRLVLGFLSPEEQAALAAHKTLVAEKKRLDEGVPKWSARAHADDEHVGSQLGLDGVVGTTLFASTAARELRDRRDALAARLKALDQDEALKRANAALEAALVAEGVASHAKQVADDNHKLAIDDHAKIEGAIDKEAMDDALIGPPDARTHCAIRIEDAIAGGCPLQEHRPVNLAERAALRQLRVTDSATKLEALAKSAMVRDVDLQAAKRTTFEARQAHLAATLAVTRERDSINEQLGAIASLKKAFDAARKNRERFADGARRLQELEDKIKASRVRQDELREETQGRVVAMQKDFDHVIQALLGRDFRGIVRQAGNRLTLAVEHHGSRESPGVDTLELIAFDLAALTHSITGHGYHPRFLVHDGPREADLALAIFQSVLLYARTLEQATPSGEPSFQYIVTTTTEPPPELRQAPWLVLTLGGAPASERLLCRDL